ncbi:DUF6924 domain-containing protein [Kitasatospora cineracea]|uniref:DUF6924 domain-containing protein n=1 Tax=Kitasatospora cineracea TaxID=88074 RepID=A0A8G1XGH6_9ACTN|nr:hypothetical protein [Kitasatospora cineracea]ROR45982.1 hypothetical protein EDD39_4235 [Kitasatospora cineracea]
MAELSPARGEGGDARDEVHLVDDPAWAGATAGAVVAPAARDEYLDVVFVADGTAMGSVRHALLALDLADEEEDGDLDPVYYRELADSPPPVREFRVAPAAVPGVHVNLVLGNMDFQELAAIAGAGPDGVFDS